MSRLEKAMADLTEALRPEWWETEEGRAATEVSRVQLSRMLSCLRRCIKVAGMDVTHEIVTLRVNEGLLELESLGREMTRVGLAIRAHQYLTQGEFAAVISSYRRMQFHARMLAQKRLRQFQLQRHTQKQIEKKMKAPPVKRSSGVAANGQPDRRLGKHPGEGRGRPKKIPFP